MRCELLTRVPSAWLQFGGFFELHALLVAADRAASGRLSSTGLLAALRQGVTAIPYIYYMDYLSTRWP